MSANATAILLPPTRTLRVIARYRARTLRVSAQ